MGACTICTDTVATVVFVFTFVYKVFYLYRFADYLKLKYMFPPTVPVGFHAKAHTETPRLSAGRFSVRGLAILLEGDDHMTIRLFAFAMRVHRIIGLQRTM